MMFFQGSWRLFFAEYPWSYDSEADSKYKATEEPRPKHSEGSRRDGRGRCFGLRWQAEGRNERGMGVRVVFKGLGFRV